MLLGDARVTKRKTKINVSKKYAENEAILNYSQINEVSSRAAPGSRVPSRSTPR